MSQRPPIVLCETDAARLSALALSAPGALAADFLLEEVERAKVVADKTIGADVVRLGAQVDFADETSGAHHTLRLVLPAQADISAGAISVLTPVGAGLIGLRPGQAIEWSDRGRRRRLRILGVRN